MMAGEVRGAVRRRTVIPDLTEERTLWARGRRLVVGVDEAGRGALAGPVVAGAVILPDDGHPEWYGQVRDSKDLTPKAREKLFDLIQGLARVSVGVVPSPIIDAVGIAEATRMAMREAVGELSPAPDFVLIDYFTVPGLRLPQRGVAEGDSTCLSIACASIVAKVTRDRMMVEFDSQYPGYGLAGHKGYGTREHVRCLCQLGPSPIHRFSFQPVRALGNKDGT